MKPKNIMLLGFVNRAVEYLDRHMDEEPDARLAELKNIDLASIKDELSDTLDASLGTMQSTMSTLLKAGNEAFDKFIEENRENKTIADEFDRIFDVSFDETRKNNQEELAKLLAFYNLDDFDVEDIDFEEEAFVDDEKKNDDNTSIIDSIINDINPEDEKIMQEISKNASENTVQENTEIIDDSNNHEELDNIFSEIVEHENSQNETADEIVNHESIPNETIDDTQEIIAEDIENEDIENTDENDDSINSLNIIENPAIDAEINETYEEVPVEDIPVEEKTIEENTINNSNEYLNSLIGDLKTQLEKEEELKKENENKNKEIYDRISKIYPYIPNGFVRTVYDLKENIAVEYPENVSIIVLHRIKFKDVDDLRKFVEIGLNHEYQINADENKLIVDIFKQFINSDGKILSNIYEIANQGYLLNGSYEGYNVLLNEEE